MAEEFTAKFKVDISDLKKNISEANRAIKEANQTFKAQTSGMENWSKNADGLSKKLEQLKTVLSNQKSILASYQSQLEKNKQAYDENGRRAEELKNKLQELASNGIAKTDEEYKKYEDALREVVKEQDNNAKACDDLKSSILDQEAAIGKTEAQIKKYSDAQKSMDKESKSITSTIDKQEKELSDLKKEYIDVVAAEGKNSASAKKLAKDIEDLSGELADNKKKEAEAEKEADKLDKSLEDLGDEADKTGSKFEGLGSKIASGLKTALVAVGTAAASAVARLTSATVSAAAYADEMLTMSTVTGVSVESLQAYSYAADLVDVSLDTMTSSMAKNIKSMSSAASGSEAYAAAYERLGVTVTNADGTLRNSEDVYWEVIDALGQMEEGADRDALAMQLFGKSAQELNPLIAQGSEGIAKLSEEAKAMGAVLSGDAIAQLANFDDSLQRLKQGASAAKNALGLVLLPQLQELADDGVELLKEFTNGMLEAGSDWGKIGDVISSSIGKLSSTILNKLPQGRRMYLEN